MTLDVKTRYNDAVNDIADVCIIGSGAGGSAVAHELTHQGKIVIILEAGNYYDADYVNQQNREDELLNLWKHHGIFLSSNFSVNVAQGQCVGGSTMINYGICFRFPDLVRNIWRDKHGIQLTDEQIDDAYTKAESQYGVTRIQQDGRSHEVIKEGCDRLGYSSDWMQKALRGDMKQNALIAYLEKSKIEKKGLKLSLKLDSYHSLKFSFTT